jgi:hypothetical protein
MRGTNTKKKKRELWNSLHNEGRHEFAKLRNVKREEVKLEKLKRKQLRKKNALCKQ